MYLKAACLIRVPVDVVKQRTQARPHLTTIQVFKELVQMEVRGFFQLYMHNKQRFMCSLGLNEESFYYFEKKIFEKKKDFFFYILSKITKNCLFFFKI